MNKGTQLALVFVAIIGVIAGVTFVKQYQPDAARPAPSSPTAEKSLTFYEVAKEWIPESASEFEKHTPGHYDFWFENPHAVAFDVRKHVQSCKCSYVGICVLKKEEADAYLKWQFAHAVAHLGNLNKFTSDLSVARLGCFDLPPTVAGEEAFKADSMAAYRGIKLQWHKFQDENDAVVLPAHAKGMVRLGWDGKKETLGPQRLTVGLTLKERDSIGALVTTARLELPLIFVGPMRITPPAVSVENLNPRETKVKEFFCWSSTNASFDLKVREATGSSCIACASFPLTPEEKTSLANQTNSRVLAGYRIAITVHERVSESNQLELGPLARRILLDSPIDAPSWVSLLGVVRGDVLVGSDTDYGRVGLGTFRAKQGAAKVVPITAVNSSIDLIPEVRVEPATLNYLVARLEKTDPVAGKKRWRLRVSVPAGSPPGPLPEHTAVLLRTAGENSRLIRIPILGMATQ